MTTPEKDNEAILLEINRLKNRIAELELDAETGQQTRDTLEKIQARYHLIADNAQDVVWTMDLDMRYTFVSPSVERLNGYSIEEFLALSLDESLSPQSAEIVRKVFEKQRTGERDGSSIQWNPRRLELELNCKDGSTVPIEATVTFIRDPSGAPIQILGASRPIIKWKQAERAALKWSHIFEHAKWGIAIFSSDGRHMEHVNAAYAEMYGYTVEEMIGMAVEAIYAPEMREEVHTFFDKLVEDGYYAYESVHVRKDGASFPVRINASVIRAEDGKVQCGAVHVEDITEHVKIERAVEAASRMEATATLAGGVAHDFNNLMVAVLGNACLIKDQVSETDPIQPLLDDIEHAAELAGSLSQQMLAYARGGKYQPKVLDLNAALDEVLNLHEHSLPPGTHIDRRIDPALWNVRADLAQMTQVIMNLCLNATEALHESGAICIQTRNVVVSEAMAAQREELEPGRYAVLIIEDTGVGMDDETLSKIFEPYFTTKEQGRGLGLAAVYGIVKNHGGYIYAESAPNEGTKITVYLPATGAASHSEATQISMSPKGSETVLVIDDEQMVLRVTKQLLEKMGYRVVCASNGKEAVNIVRSYTGTIELAILDLGMPIMGGAEAFPILRSERPDMKVVICSGYDLDATSQNLLDSGASAFIHKPFRPSELGTEIRRVLDS